MILLVPLSFLAVLVAAEYAAPAWPLKTLAAAAFVLGVVVLLAARRPLQVVMAMVALAVTLALLRVEIEPLVHHASPAAELLAGQPAVALRGVVVEPPIPRERTQQARLRIDAVRAADGEWQATTGLAQVTVPPELLLAYGDVLEVRGKVKLPETTAPAGYATALRRQGVDAVVAFPAVQRLGREAPDRLRAVTFAIRARASAAIEAFLPEPHAALVEGILAGQRTTIPPALTEALNRSGTSHITAVSGFNVTVVTAGVLWLLGGMRWRRGWQRALLAMAASGALWGFVLLVGASGSVLRAAAMAQLALVGRALGRQGTAGALLLWGSVFLAAWRPATLVDAGWQLSFLGAAGLIWLSGPITLVLRGLVPRLPGLVAEPLAATIAAQIAVLPVLAAVFGRVSLIAPLANALVLPLVTPIMLGGALLLVTSTLFPPAAPLVASLTWVPTQALLWIVRTTAVVPFAAKTLPAWPAWAVAGYLSLLCGVAAYAQQRGWTSPTLFAGHVGMAPATLPTTAPGAPVLTGGGGSRLGTLALASLACLAGVACAMAAPLLPLSSAEAGGAPTLTLEIPAAVEGTLMLAQEAGGARVLVNGGPTTSGAVALLGQTVRPWDRTVDVVVLADAREAYVLGLARVLERYRVGLLVDAVDDYASSAYHQVRQIAARRGVPRLQAEPGMELAIGASLVIEVLGTQGRAANGASAAAPPRTAEPAALRLRSGDFSLLIPGDGSLVARRALLAGAQPLGSTALLLADRTTRQTGPAGGEALLRAASPEVAIVQGAPRAAAGAPPLPPVALTMPEGEPEPAWHHTDERGALRIEVRDSGYRLLPAP